MTKLKRFNSVIAGLVMIIVALIMMVFPENSYIFILLFLGMGFLISGIGTLYYYFSLAVFMTGGKRILYKGVLLTDFAVMTLSLSNVPKVYILLYLAVIHMFSGVVEILRANETRQSGSKHFKLKLTHGILNVLIAVCCIIFIRNTNAAVIIYSIGLVNSGVIRIATAFRRSTFVYIQ